MQDSHPREAGIHKVDITALIARQTELINRIVLQEVFLEDLAEDGSEDLEDDELKQEFVNVFGSIGNWEAEFSALAASQRNASGWVVLAWCDRFERLQIIATGDGLM